MELGSNHPGRYGYRSSLTRALCPLSVSFYLSMFCSRSTTMSFATRPTWARTGTRSWSSSCAISITTGKVCVTVARYLIVFQAPFESRLRVNTPRSWLSSSLSLCMARFIVCWRTSCSSSKVHGHHSHCFLLLRCPSRFYPLSGAVIAFFVLCFDKNRKNRSQSQKLKGRKLL